MQQINSNIAAEILDFLKTSLQVVPITMPRFLSDIGLDIKNMTGLGTDGASVLCGWEQMVGVCCVAGNRWWECAVWLGTDGGSVMCDWEQMVGVCCVTGNIWCW